METPERESGMKSRLRREAVAAIALACSLSITAGAQQFTQQGPKLVGAGAAGASSQGNTYSLDFFRNDLNLAISPQKTTIDTLWVLPPGVPGLSQPRGTNIARIVQSLTVRIDSIIHPNDGDLVVSLRHFGIVDTLFNNASAGGANFIGTILDDQAATHVSAATGPFTGRFVPTSPLSQFTSMDATGAWILEVFDRSRLNTGTLRAWGVMINAVTVTTAIAPHSHGAPEGFQLLQNYPNPFNPSTVIHYALPRQARVTLRVYNTLGQEVMTLVDSEEGAGAHEVHVDARNLASGVYLYRIQAGEFTSGNRMVLLK
jgi:hypothetical protein